MPHAIVAAASTRRPHWVRLLACPDVDRYISASFFANLRWIRGDNQNKLQSGLDMLSEALLDSCFLFSVHTAFLPD